MKQKQQLTSIILAIAFFLSLALILGVAPQETTAQVQPALAQLAADEPDTVVRVMVRGEGDLQSQIEKLGGVIVHDLHIIDALAVEMPAASAIELSQLASVNWISLDGEVIAANEGSNLKTVRDEFSSVSYENNDGTEEWASKWIEFGDNNNKPGKGKLKIKSNRLQFLAEAKMIQRAANLSGATTATLSFDYRRKKFVDANDYVSLEISIDGGASWSELNRFSGPDNDGGLQPVSYDISNYISSYTLIRFTSSWTFSDRAIFKVDNVEIAYDSNAAPGGTPSDEGGAGENNPTGENYYLDTLNVRPVWEMGLQGQGVSVAVIDSGVANDKDFRTNMTGNVGPKRLIVRLGFNAKQQKQDKYGHGTHVAGIIGGNGRYSGGAYAGIAPLVNLISLNISDKSGMAYESDTVAAMQWVLENKDEHNIRVVNLSINSIAQQSYHQSPINAAGEILWFNGIVVVVSAGNNSGGMNSVNAAPANDPFFITVGASQENNDSNRNNDWVANFSSRGTTIDGHNKPELIAPGKNIISVLSKNSDWENDHFERVVDEEYFRLSGTSMSAPMVAGTVALLLQDEPWLTPDQVKYRLISVGQEIGGGSGYGVYLDVLAAINGSSTESANTGIQANQMLWGGEEPVNWNNVNWNSVNWNSVNWNAVNWNSVNWNAVNWNSVNWND